MMTTISTIILFVALGAIGIVVTNTAKWLGFAIIVAAIGCIVGSLVKPFETWVPDRTRRERSLFAVILIAVALALTAGSLIWAKGVVMTVLLVVAAILLVIAVLRLVSILTGRAINWMFVVSIMLVLLVLPLLFMGNKGSKPDVEQPAVDITDVTDNTDEPADTTDEPVDTTDEPAETTGTADSQYCPKAEHQWGEGIESKDRIVFVCENCGEVKVEEIPQTDTPTTQKPSTQKPSTQKPSTQAPTTQAPVTQTPSTQAPHSHSYVGSVTVAATCKNTGVKTYSCSCGSTYTENVAMVSHSYTETIVKAATEYAAGEKRLTCTGCGHTKTETIDKLKHYTHKYVLDKVLVEATCEDDGIAQYKCPCGATETRAIPANGEHEWDEGVITINPTVNRTGMRKDTCEICGATNLVVIPKLDDDDDNYYGDDDCSHSYKKTTVEKPTAYEGGKVEYTCRKCGDSYTETTDPENLKLRASDTEMKYGETITVTTNGYAFNLVLVNDDIARLDIVDENTAKVVLTNENAGGSLVVYDSIVPTTQVEIIIKPNLD